MFKDKASNFQNGLKEINWIYQMLSNTTDINLLLRSQNHGV